MINAFDANAQDVGLSLDEIESEIRAGLATHADRLVAAYDNEEFYACRNTAYITPREGEDTRDFLKRPKRTSKLTHAVITKLAKGLYSPGPTRRLKGAAGADAFLQEVYECNKINALMKQCDRRATLNGYAAVQVHATGRPEKPITLYLWGAHETVVWTWPDDPGVPWAVCTIVREDKTDGSVKLQRLRYDAWSRDEHRVYQTRWLVVPTYDVVHTGYRACFGQTAFYQQSLSGMPVGSGKNPYGVLPFAFAHTEPVVSDFYEGGLGDSLSDCNAELDRELSDLAQHAAEFMNPDRFTSGVSPKWRREKRAGQWQRLIPGKDAEGEAGMDPKAFLVQGDLAITSVWENLTSYANTTLEDLDVPLVAIHSDASTDLSGIAIVAKHIPLLERTRERQPLFAVVEVELAQTVLLAAGNFYGEAALSSASDAELDLVWPAPRFPLPTPERDAADTWEMDAGVKSLVDVVSERQGITHPAAKESILRVIDDNAWLKSVMPEPEPVAAPVDPNADPADADQATADDADQDAADDAADAGGDQ